MGGHSENNGLWLQNMDLGVGWLWWKWYSNSVLLHNMFWSSSLFPESHLTFTRPYLVAFGLIFYLYSILKLVPLVSRDTEAKQFPPKLNSSLCFWLKSPHTKFFPQYNETVWVGSCQWCHQPASSTNSPAWSLTFESLQPKEAAKEAVKFFGRRRLCELVCYSNNSEGTDFDAHQVHFTDEWM